MLGIAVATIVPSIEPSATAVIRKASTRPRRGCGTAESVPGDPPTRSGARVSAPAPPTGATAPATSTLAASAPAVPAPALVFRGSPLGTTRAKIRPRGLHQRRGLTLGRGEPRGPLLGRAAAPGREPQPPTARPAGGAQRPVRPCARGRVPPAPLP